MAEELETLEHLRELLSLFHVANDAEDHWSGAEATQIRDRAVTGLRSLFEAAPFLAKMFPTLVGELDTVHERDISWSTWRQLEREIEQRRKGGADYPTPIR